MKPKSVNIINQLPIGIVGRVVHENDVESLDFHLYGVIVKEKQQYGGRVVLINWANITSVEVHDDGTTQDNEGTRDEGETTIDNREFAQTTKRGGPSRPRKISQNSNNN